MNGYRVAQAVCLMGWLAYVPVEAQAGAEGVAVTQIWFQEREPGVAASALRMLVSERFLRMDDGEDRGDFILYDRKARVITSVDRGARSLIRIVHREVKVAPPLPMDTQIWVREAPDAPSVAGAAPRHVGVTTNGETCYELIAVPGLLDSARRAMQEFLETLAGEQAMNLGKTPVEMQSACALSNLVFDPARRLDYGFPIREWDHRGYARALLRFEQGLRVDPAVFTIPSGYRTISLTPKGMEISPP